jgi:hypothetical protein
MLRGGCFAQGVLSGDPDPHAITLLTVVDEVGGSAASGSTRTSAYRGNPEARRRPR